MNAILRAAPLALTLTLVASAATAQPPGGPHGGPPGYGGHGTLPPMERFLDEHAERLGIDGATREKMRAIEEKAREEGRVLDDRYRKLHQEMHGLLDVEKPDVEAVMRQADKIGEAQAEVLKHHLRQCSRSAP